MSDVFSNESNCNDGKFNVHKIQNRLIKILSSDDYTSIYRSPRKKLSALHLAIISGDINLVKKYCNNSIVNNISDNALVAPIHLAIEFTDNPIETRIQIINILLDNGADINCKDKFGESVLYKATRYSENQSLVSYLLSKGAFILENDPIYIDELLLQRWLKRSDIEERYKYSIREKLKNL
jgi:ankyrin repeat protein